MANSADPDQKPTDLDLHCLLRQGMSYSAREGLIMYQLKSSKRVFVEPSLKTESKKHISQNSY